MTASVPNTNVIPAHHTTSYWVLLSLVWCAGITLVFGTLAVTRFSRTK